MTSQGVCGRCNQPMDPARATYDKNGTLLCVQCAALNTIDEGEGRASTSLIGSAFGVLGSGLMAFTCLNILWIPAILAIIGGVGWLASVGRLPLYRKRLGTMYPICVAVVILGILLGIGSILVGALQVAPR